MTEDLSVRDVEANRLIRKHVGLSMAGGAIPIPVLDLTAVAAVQLSMLKSLAQIYDVPLEPRSARAFITAITTALGANLAGRAGASVVKMVPLVGSLIGGVGQALGGGAATYAVGHVVRRRFARGESIEHLSVAAIRDEAKRYYEKGLAVARELWGGGDS